MSYPIMLFLAILMCGGLLGVIALCLLAQELFGVGGGIAVVVLFICGMVYLQYKSLE